MRAPRIGGEERAALACLALMAAIAVVANVVDAVWGTAGLGVLVCALTVAALGGAWLLLSSLEDAMRGHE